MVLEDMLGAAKRKVGRLGQYAVLGLALAFGSCGEGNVPPEGDDTETTENPCGNSPVFGKYLWEISKCSWSIHMREDCLVGAKGLAGAREGEYNYALPNWGGETPYRGLALYFPEDGGNSSPLDPTLRFSPEAGENWQKINQKLDLYGGYVLVRDCSRDNLDDCVFVPLDMPWSDNDTCKASPYYWEN